MMDCTVTKKLWDGEKVKLKMEKVRDKSVWEIGLIVLGQAKLLAPVRFGYLAASLTLASSTESNDVDDPSKYAKDRTDWLNATIKNFRKITPPIKTGVVLVGTVVEYAPYQEYIHRPFLRPSLDMARGKAITIMMVNGRMEFVDYLGGKKK